MKRYASVEKARDVFIAVKNELHNKDMIAYRLAFSKPLNFYRENGKMRAIQILKEEAQNDNQ